MSLLQNKNEYKTENKVTVSIIIATYRRKESLRRALESIIKQTYDRFEIILVDDNADLEWNNITKTIVEEINFLHPILYIKNDTNKGSAETRNIGIKAASGDYITFLDDDDIYLPNKIKNQIEYMQKKKADFCITDLDLYNENDKLIEKRIRSYIKDYRTQELLKYHLMYHITGTDTMMFKKDYLKAIGDFSPINVGDEFYLMLKAIEAGGKFAYLPTCDVKAYVHSVTSGMSSGESKINGENELFEFKKKSFNCLKKKEIRYIRMRHYAVLAYAELRRKRFVPFIVNSVLSFLSSPISCIKLFLN